MSELLQSVNAAAADVIPVGKIVAPHGIEGLVRVKCLSDFPERLTKPGPRWLQKARDPAIEVRLLRGQYYPSKDLYLIQFAEIRDRTRAESWIGATVLVSRQDRPTLGTDEFYCPDLLGLEVFHQPTGRKLGIVTEIIPAGNDLLQITTPDQQSILIPFVKLFVPIVDLEQRRIEVDPPAGLLD